MSLLKLKRQSVGHLPGPPVKEAPFVNGPTSDVSPNFNEPSISVPKIVLIF
jgi:hypothetical protein